MPRRLRDLTTADVDRLCDPARLDPDPDGRFDPEPDPEDDGSNDEDDEP